MVDLICGRMQLQRSTVKMFTSTDGVKSNISSGSVNEYQIATCQQCISQLRQGKRSHLQLSLQLQQVWNFIFMIKVRKKTNSEKLLVSPQEYENLSSL